MYNEKNSPGINEVLTEMSTSLVKNEIIGVKYQSLKHEWLHFNRPGTHAD